MTKKIEIGIQPKYGFLKDFIENLPVHFNDNGTIIQDQRNLIKALTVDNLEVNVKRFRIPILFNRIVYTLFRKPKVYKAYNNALELIKKGFSTPEPIAYIKESENGLISYSYFISKQLQDVREVREYYFTKGETPRENNFLLELARYTAKLHDANVLHLDYSTGNILMNNDEKPKFFLVDINRMKFCNVDINQGCENFRRLFEYDQAMKIVAKEYGKCRNLDAAQCEKLMLDYKHKFEAKKARKVRLKKFLGISK